MSFAAHQNILYPQVFFLQCVTFFFTVLEKKNPVIVPLFSVLSHAL
jgi:hypothetical protein